MSRYISHVCYWVFGYATKPSHWRHMCGVCGKVRVKGGLRGSGWAWDLVCGIKGMFVAGVYLISVLVG